MAVSKTVSLSGSKSRRGFVVIEAVYIFYRLSILDFPFVIRNGEVPVLVDLKAGQATWGG